MRLSSLIFGICFSLAAGVPLLAASDSADLPHVHVQLVSEQAGVQAPGKIVAGLYFKLESGWHVYWKNPGDAGEPPRINWTLPNGVQAEGIQFPAPKRLPLGPLMDFGYEDQVLFPVQLDVESSVKLGSTMQLPAKVMWLVCRESCIPEKANLELDLPVVGAKPASNAAFLAAFKHAHEAMPKPLPAKYKVGFSPAGQGFNLMLETGQRETIALFFPADFNIIDNPAPQKLIPMAKGLTLELKKDSELTTVPAEINGVIELSDGRAFELSARAGALVSADKATAPATAMPTKAPEVRTPSTAAPLPTQVPVAPQAAPTGPRPTSFSELLRTAGLAFLGGLILNLMPCVFPVLFIKGLALVQSGNEQRHKLRTHGFVYAVGILVSFWVLVGVLLGLRDAGSHLGWGFQFQSPVFLSLMAGLLFFLGLSLAGQFEIGLSLTSAGGSLATKQGYAGSFFTGVLAVIVATPCTAPFMGVAVGFALRQSAAVTFAIFTALALGLAAPYVALTLQPAWTKLLPRPGVWMEVLKQATAVPIFGTVIWLSWVLAQAYGAALLAALLASFLLLAMAGWFLGRWPLKRWATVAAAMILLCVVGLSVFAPAKLMVAAKAADVSQLHGGWQPWSAGAVKRYQAEGRPVFVDFTASWCLSCQVNERVALKQAAVEKAFADANVVLLRADWTQYDDSITQALSTLDRSGVPAYALYSPGQSQPQMLPEVLTPGVLTDALSKLPRTATQTAASSSNLK